MEEIIVTILKNIIEEIDIEKVPNEYREEIKVNILKNESISFMCFQNILLKYTPLKTRMFVEIRKIDEINVEELKTLFEDVRYSDDSLYLKIYINEIEEIYKLKNMIKKIYIFLYNNEPVDTYGCCSRFVECSDNLKCVNPDKKLSRGCMYRSNLEKGKIFYGKNRNV